MFLTESVLGHVSAQVHTKLFVREFLSRAIECTTAQTKQDMQAETYTAHQHTSTQHTASAVAAHSSPQTQRTTQAQQSSRCSMNPQQSRYSSSDVGDTE